MNKNDRYAFEFCPDTTDQMAEVFGMTYNIRLDYAKAKDICRVCGVRARVLKNGSYVSHIFEDGGTG